MRAPHDSRSGAPPATTSEDGEPDYRFTLANERTFPAWLRTSLSLLAAGVAVVQLVPDFSVPAARGILGGLLAALAIVAAGAGALRWRSVENAIRRGRPLPASLAARVAVPLLGATVVLLSALIGLVTIVGGPS